MTFSAPVNALSACNTGSEDRCTESREQECSLCSAQKGSAQKVGVPCSAATLTTQGHSGLHEAAGDGERALPVQLFGRTASAQARQHLCANVASSGDQAADADVKAEEGPVN